MYSILSIITAVLVQNWIVAIIIIPMTLIRRFKLRGQFDLIPMYWAVPTTLVSGAFWWFSGADLPEIGANMSRTASIVVILFSEKWDIARWTNVVTIRIPVLRDLVWASARLFETLKQHLQDIIYVYRIEDDRRDWRSRLKMFLGACIEAVTQTIDGIKRLSLVVEARGCFPPLPSWYDPEPLHFDKLVRDLIFAGALWTLLVAALLLI